MLSFRILAPALLALAGCVAAQDAEPTTSAPAESSPTLSTTQTASFSSLPTPAPSNQTTSSPSFSSLTTSDPTTLSQVVLTATTTTTSSTSSIPNPTKSNQKEKPTLFSEYGCQGRNQSVEPDNRCYAFGTDELEEYFAGISVPSGTVCDWYEASNCTEKFWSYMQFPGDCQFGYFARTRAKSIKCYRDRRAL